MEKIAAALKEAAKLAGWNATAIAAACGKSEQSASHWLRGKVVMSGPDLMHLRVNMPYFSDRLDAAYGQ